MFAINPVRRTEVHGNTVLNDAILLQDLIEDAQRTAAVDHEIFRKNLEPVHDRFSREDMMVVRGTQANSNAVVRESIKAISGQLIFSQSELQRRTSPEAGEKHRPLAYGPICEAIFRQAVSLPSAFRRSCSRPCPCRSSEPCIRYRTTCSRPYLCRSFGLYKRAGPLDLSPSLTSPACPGSRRSSQPWRWTADLTPGRHCHSPANPRALHQRSSSSLSLSEPSSPLIYCDRLPHETARR